LQLQANCHTLAELIVSFCAFDRGDPFGALMDEGDSVALVQRPGKPSLPDMVWIPGGPFRMGSDKHYPEEAPVHRVTVDGFWIDQTPVTNRQFKQFVRATGHKTFSEISPNPKNYPGALPHMLYAGSLVFTPPHVRSI
jgi:formylglycine-generating enzyme required for sulfatase activity